MNKNIKLLDKYQGCFLGLAYGDAYGASYEGGILERLLWSVIGKTKKSELRYTDDTQMSIDIAEFFLIDNALNQNDLALRFAASYQWSRGYGPSAAKILKNIKAGRKWQTVNRLKYQEGSLGNGAAMRSPILALCFPMQDVLISQVHKVSEITHAHPLAIEGAQLIAFATLCALQNYDNLKTIDSLLSITEYEIFKKKLLLCKEMIQNGESTLSNKEIKNMFGNGITASHSCVTAIYFALSFREQNFTMMIDQICNLGGDTDTIAAMAGAIWGAYNGEAALDCDKENKVEGMSKLKNLAYLIFEQS